MILSLLLLACSPATMQLLEYEASAVALGGARPWSVDHETLASTTDWTVYTVPNWTRQVLVKNEHASATLWLGRYDETGAADVADPTSDEIFGIAPGAAITLTVTRGDGTSFTDSVHDDIPLTSTTASHPVSFFLAETPE